MNQNFKNIIRDNIRKIIKAKKITQTKIAEHLNLSEKGFSELMNDEENISLLKHIDKISEYLGMTTVDIVMFENKEYIKITELQDWLSSR